jgi:hypothetical protein
LNRDNDLISVKVNGAYILYRQKVKKKKRTIRSRIKKGKNVVEIIAENEGYLKNNTARIELIGSRQIHPIISELKPNKKTSIILDL